MKYRTLLCSCPYEQTMKHWEVCKDEEYAKNKAQAIHAYKGEQARIKQLLNFTSELDASGYIPPSPRAFVKRKISLRDIMSSIRRMCNVWRFAP